MPTIGQFLIDRIKPLASHVFGLPGDYVLNFYDQLARRTQVVNTTDEQCVGFAADAYARVNGFGVACVTYCVGGFKLINSIAGAYAEKSPVLVISGAPGVKEQNSELLLHHMVSHFECQSEMFRPITCARAVLNDPNHAGFEIDRVIEAIKHYKQPGYIEIPRDMVDVNVGYDVFSQGLPKKIQSRPDNLDEALEKSWEWIARSKNPVILAGVEVSRFGLGKEIVKFAETANIPMACTLLGKSVVNERHPLFLGIYCGPMSEPHVREAIEGSDCVIMLGVMQTDMNLAFQPLKCDQTNVIFSNTDRCRIRRSTYEQVNFYDFASKLLSVKMDKRPKPQIIPRPSAAFVPQPSTLMTSARLFEKINAILDEKSAIIADVGDSLFGAMDLTVHHRNNFLAPAFYTSMGFAVPAALGVAKACPDVLPIVIVGDGAFQMTGMEFSTLVRHKQRCIVFVLNNRGFTTERLLLDEEVGYNDVQNWEYHKIPSIVGGGCGYLVETEEQLEDAVSAALKSNTACLIEVRVSKTDATPALRRMTESLSQKV